MLARGVLAAAAEQRAAEQHAKQARSESVVSDVHVASL
jgi:hypothetical protein